MRKRTLEEIAAAYSAPGIDDDQGQGLTPERYQAIQRGRTEAVRRTMGDILQGLEQGRDIADIMRRVVVRLAPVADDGEAWQERCLALLEDRGTQYAQLSLLTETDRARDALGDLCRGNAKKLLRRLESMEKTLIDIKTNVHTAANDLAAAIDAAAQEDTRQWAGSTDGGQQQT